MISAWARRAAILWAVLPPLAIAAMEKIFFNTTYVGAFLGYRLAGWFKQAFYEPPKGGQHLEPIASVTLIRFLTTPGLWIGLGFAAAFVSAAVRLRRNREPI